MKVIKPSYEILTTLSNDRDNLYLLKDIERAARTCYKSENNITDASCITLCKSLISRGHEAMLEHSQLSIKFIVDRGISHEIVRHRLFSFAQESTRYCVAGDSLLKFSNSHYHSTVCDLYRNKEQSKNDSWKKLKIKQMDDNGNLVFGNIDNIFYMGEKEVYLISTKLGYNLKCTADHLIYTSNGYRPLKDITIGDSIYVNGTHLSQPLYKSYDWLYHQYVTLNKTFDKISEDFGYNVSTIKKWASKLNIPRKPLCYFNIGRSTWNKGLRENDCESINKRIKTLRKYHHCGSRKDCKLKHDTSVYQKRNNDICCACGAKECVLEVHHTDENHNHHDPDNLITVCRPHHRMIHTKNLDIIALDSVTSIVKCGIEDVYDISMKHYSNFVANGVIVHNCNYSKDKFCSEIKVVEPEDVNPISSSAYKKWYDSCLFAEKTYFELLSDGIKPEIARNVLPTSLATEIVVTGNIREWRHFFELRVTNFAHPQIRFLSRKLLDELKSKIPVLFDDIIYDS